MPPKRIKAAAAAPSPAPAASAAPAPAAATILPVPAGFWRALALLTAFLQPAAGLVLALLYWKAAEPSSRRFSRFCLVLALLGWAVAGGNDAVNVGLQSGERYIQPY